ncbi:MAG: polysaccharide deacetylase family protein [Rhizobiaceae bacterium]|nr:polysaccharide deacetylase family protein [Rhizobiaceae bacterium]
MTMARLVKALDLALARMPAISRGPDLVILGFHSVLDGMDDLRGQTLDPFQPLTLADLETTVSLLRARGFGFVNGRHVDRPETVRRAAWLTFDDGYANNLKAVPLLERLRVPFTVFVSTGYVESGEAYWWDVLHRESRRRNVPAGEAVRRREALKQLEPAAIRGELVAAFGEASLRPEGELDRPMTPAETVALSRHPLAEIGNHTHSHAILPVVAPAARREEITRCQSYLARLTGAPPISIAYPNGGFDPESVAACASAGLRNGVTCLPGRIAPWPVDDAQSRLTLARSVTLQHGRIERELNLSISPLRIASLLAERDRIRCLRPPAHRR